MAKIERFEKFVSWQTARELNHLIYKVARNGACAKYFGLRGRQRGASIVVRSNLSEWFKQGGDNGFVHFSSMEKGSCAEMPAQGYAALDQSDLTSAKFKELSERRIEISRMISGAVSYSWDSELHRIKFKKPSNE